jgi:hypothetical protein
MKKIFYLIIFVLIGFTSISQTINTFPNSNWPYLLDEFSSCIIIHNDGNVTKAMANYNLLSEELQFQKNNKIMSVTDPEDIKEVTFDEFKMVYLHGNFYVGLNNEKGNVINIFKKIKGNMNDLLEAKGAYGSSTTTAATMQQAEIDIGGINNMNVRMLWDNKSEGKEFRINENYFYKTPDNNELISLKKSNLYRSLPDLEKNIKAFFKREKNRLKDDADVKKLANYLNNL